MKNVLAIVLMFALAPLPALAQGIQYDPGSEWYRPGNSWTGAPASASGVAIGDSITYGIGSTGDAIGYPSLIPGLTRRHWRLTNLGVGGDKTSDVIARISAATGKGYRVGVPLIGINDCGAGVATATIISNVQSIQATLAGDGQDVIPVTILPTSNTTWNTCATTVNGTIRTDAAAAHRVLVDTVPFFSDGSGSGTYVRTDIVPGGLHPNDDGYSVLAALVAAALRPAPEGRWDFATASAQGTRGTDPVLVGGPAIGTRALPSGRATGEPYSVAGVYRTAGAHQLAASDGTSWAGVGVGIFSAYTNALGWGDTLAAWNAGSCTIDVASVDCPLAPDGTQTMAKIHSCTIYGPYTAGAGKPTRSVFMARPTAAANCTKIHTTYAGNDNVTVSLTGTPQRFSRYKAGNSGFWLMGGANDPTGCAAWCIWRAQLEAGVVVSPPVYTDGSSTAVPATLLHVPSPLVRSHGQPFTIGVKGTPSGPWNVVNRALISLGVSGAPNTARLTTDTSGNAVCDVFDENGGQRTATVAHEWTTGEHSATCTGGSATLTMTVDGVAAAPTLTGAGTGLIADQPFVGLVGGLSTAGTEFNGWMRAARICPTAGDCEP